MNQPQIEYEPIPTPGLNVLLVSAVDRTGRPEVVPAIIVQQREDNPDLYNLVYFTMSGQPVQTRVGVRYDPAKRANTFHYPKVEMRPVITHAPPPPPPPSHFQQHAPPPQPPAHAPPPPQPFGRDPRDVELEALRAKLAAMEQASAPSAPHSS